VIGVAGTGPDGLVSRSVAEAAMAEPELNALVRVVEVPDRFVSGEGGALVNAVNGKPAIPPGRKRRASDAGVDGLPTLLSNAETFAQLAVLVMLGPDGYASTGTTDEPGTVLLTVGGAVSRPAVVEVPSGIPLGVVLDICGARVADGVLVGGYHGKWLPREAAYNVPVSRAGLAAAGGALGAGIVLPLGEGTCPVGEVARISRYLAKESSGQCGPCQLGLPGIARSLSALAEGSGGWTRWTPRGAPRAPPVAAGVQPPGRRIQICLLGHRGVHRRPGRARVPRRLRPAGGGHPAA
jgi:NADH:ubiquinone oxidoreductase subunit F (NADH-binding)